MTQRPTGGEPSRAPRGPEAAGRFSVVGQAVVFGFPDTPVELSVRRRAASWRVGGAAQRLTVFLVAAPLVAVFPPHVPWALGALTTGIVLARRRWIERFTLERVEGACPKCGQALVVKPSRLRLPHPVTCEACHHQAALRFPEAVLAESARG